ncbi:hypothetical protein F5H01DRAFT_331634 [Linnemannia elongata]|nr:hypothetical protein F5H01DRAFT_331634 [Linnemannia elongata]
MSRSRHAHLLSLVSLSQNSISHFFAISTGLSVLLHLIHLASFFHFLLSYSSSYSCLSVRLHLLFLALLLLSPYKIIETNPQ